jgi:hypothetical protein
MILVILIFQICNIISKYYIKNIVKLYAVILIKIVVMVVAEFTHFNKIVQGHLYQSR